MYYSTVYLVIFLLCCFNVSHAQQNTIDRLNQIEKYVLNNQLDNAIAALEKVDATTLSQRDQIKYYTFQGKISQGNQRHSEALEHYYKAIDLIQQNKFDELLPRAYFNVASVLTMNRDLVNSTKYYRYTLAEAQKVNDEALIIDVYKDLCLIYNGRITLNLDSSVYYGELGVALARNSNDELRYGQLMDMVSAPLIRNGEYRRGLKMSQEALVLAEKYNFPLKRKYYLTLNQGFAYEKLGSYDSALIMMKKGGSLRPEGVDHFRLGYLIYKAMGDFKNSIWYLEQYRYKYDSIVKSRHNNKLSALQARLETNQKEREVESLSQTAELQGLQLKQQQYFLFGMMALIIVLLGGGMLVYRQRKLKQDRELAEIALAEAKKHLEIEKQYREAELKALRSQMNPHFIFNALNSIQKYIVNNEKKLAGKYLGKFADLMRMYLKHSQSQLITVKEEIDALKLYLELEKVRFDESLDYSLSDGLEAADMMSIPPLLIQPFVENAIKHGLLHKQNNRKLAINLSSNEADGKLKCIIEDNGIGREESAKINQLRNPEHESFAMSAIKTRIDLLNESMPQPIALEIVDLTDHQDQPSGTRVEIKIPITDN